MGGTRAAAAVHGDDEPLDLLWAFASVEAERRAALHVEEPLPERLDGRRAALVLDASRQLREAVETRRERL